MPLTDPPPASIWPMDLTSDLQNIENPLDAYIKKMEGKIKPLNMILKKNAKDFCRFCLFPEDKEV